MKDITLNNVTYIYDHRKSDGVCKINLSLKEGELCSIIGPSGSGKTTLLRLISKQLVPQSGSVYLPENYSIGYYSPNETPNESGNNENDSFTLLDFLKEGTQLNEDIIRDQVSFLELSDDLLTPLISLSTGQWHRAQMAKFFFNDHQILLLDEPFVHLDPNRRQFIADVLLQLAKENKKFVFWVTHFIDDALLLSDKILLLQYGVQQQFSTPSNLFWNPENLFSAQYLGPNNLLLGVPSHDQSFETALGKILGLQKNSDSPIIEKEVLLMCRPHLCQINHNFIQNLANYSQWKMNLKKVSFVGSIQRFEFQSDHRLWWVDQPTTPNTEDNYFKIGSDYWISIPNSSWVILHTY